MKNLILFSLLIFVSIFKSFSGTPVLSPPHTRSSTDDAETIWNALQADEVDTDAIINVLARHTNVERLAIIDDFRTLHNEDLIEDLKEKLSGDFENLIVAMLTRLPQYYADELNRAMVGAGTDEDDLTEILISLSNAQIKATNQIYSTTYEQTLGDALAEETSGEYKDLLVLLSQAERDENTSTDEDEAATDAEALSAADEDTLFETFSDVFSHRSYDQLQLIFEAYENLAGESIETAIDDNFSGDVVDALLAIVEISRNRPGYFARRLNESLSGIGTSDSDLVRLIVTRSEIDIDAIKEEYEAQYSTPLADAITDDTSGDYQKCLLTLIGEL